MKWISTQELMPMPGAKVLIVRDTTKWNYKSPRMIDIAHVGFFHEDTDIGGPNALTGRHTMKGIFFSVPAILHPDSVTHWMELPELP